MRIAGSRPAGLEADGHPCIMGIEMRDGPGTRSKVDGAWRASHEKENTRSLTGIPDANWFTVPESAVTVHSSHGNTCFRLARCRWIRVRESRAAIMSIRA